MLSADELKKLAQLSRISVSDEELATIGQEIEPILNYVKEVSSVVAGDSTGAAAAAPVLRNVVRDDGKPLPTGAFTEAILKNMPDTEDGYLKVKKIL